MSFLPIIIKAEKKQLKLNPKSFFTKIDAKISKKKCCADLYK